jgi:hypothetical protein
MRRELVTCVPIVFVVFALALAGCGSFVFGPGVAGSGHVKTESRSVSGFDTVSLSGVGDLTIQQTGTESLTITTDDNLLPLITTEVTGTRLVIGLKPGTTNLQPTHGIQYRLTVKNLRNLQISGAGTVKAGPLQTDTLTVADSGAGTITIANLTTGDLQVTLSGAGVVTVSGQTTSQEVTLSGVGSYHARNLASQTANLQLSGAGNAEVQVSQTLTVTVSGAGSVTYYGNPTVTQHVSGAGSVTHGS